MNRAGDDRFGIHVVNRGNTEVRPRQMCVLRVESKKKTLAKFLASARLPVYESHEKREIQRRGPEKGMPFEDSGLKSAVSDKDWSDLTGQVEDAICFLRRYRTDILRLRKDFQCQVDLDFPYEVRLGRNGIFAQSDYLPPRLLSLAGELGIGIEMSLYPAFVEASPQEGCDKKRSEDETSLTTGGRRRDTAPPPERTKNRRMSMKRIGIVSSALLVAGLIGGPARGEPPAGGTFGDDLEFLKKHGEVVVLSAEKGEAQVAVSAQYQGRVMTSTSAGAKGLSYGWINRELIASGKKLEHFNPIGGEDRFWMGPEGGQFSIFFAKDAPFDLAHWQTPPAVDTEPFEVVSKSESSVSFRKAISLVNYSGTKFDVLVEREVKLIPAAQAWKDLGVEPAKGVKLVAFESVNKITNTGTDPWTKEHGLLSLWILCMFNPSPATTVVAPIKAGPESELGKVVTDDYFGKVPADRLVAKDNAVFFSADGKCRSKIGFSQKRCRGVLGSYDAANKVLTLASYTLPKEPADYVNSAWKIQDKPFAGDAVNSYNDGPPSPGVKPLGPFYELESSSPAGALAPKQSLSHTHRTIHLQGSEADLDPIARQSLGVSIQDIVGALAKKP